MRKEAHDPLLIVVAGPNGSGKTTITSEVIASEWLEDAVYINPDNVAQDKFGDWNSPDAVRPETVCRKISGFANLDIGDVQIVMDSLPARYPFGE